MERPTKTYRINFVDDLIVSLRPSNIIVLMFLTAHWPAKSIFVLGRQVAVIPSTPRRKIVSHVAVSSHALWGR